MPLMRVVTAAVLGSALLSGCFSSADGTSSSAIDVESGPLVMPPEAGAQTAAGAEAFARHFLAQRDYAFATGDVAPLTALSGPTCWFCGTELQVIDMSWRVGRGWEKTATTISSIELVAGQPPGPVELVVVYSCGESKVFDVKGGTIQVYPALTNQSGRLSLEPGESSYLVSDMHTIAPYG